MRSVWKGVISFGLVNIPVKLYTARKKHIPSFKYLHKICGTPLKYERYCPKCDKEVPWEEVVRGYEYEKGKFVVLNDSDFERIAQTDTKRIDVIEFIEITDLDPIYYDNAYYVDVEKGGEKGLALFYRVLKDTGKAALGKVVFRDREHLVVIRPYNDTLILHTLYYSDEILPPPRKIGKLGIRLSPAEIRLAKELIDSLSGSLEIDQFKDEYKERLLHLIEGKIHGIEPSIPVEQEITETKELLASLKASVERLRKKGKKHD